MLVKVDEDLPRALVAMLRENGYDAAGVAEEQMSGWEDDDLWGAIQAEQRFLVTADKGFADARRHPPGTHAGILLLRPEEESVRSVTALLGSVLSRFDLCLLRGTVSVVTPAGLRVRQPRP